MGLEPLLHEIKRFYTENRQAIDIFNTRKIKLTYENVNFVNLLLRWRLIRHDFVQGFKAEKIWNQKCDGRDGFSFPLELDMLTLLEHDSSDEEGKKLTARAREEIFSGLKQFSQQDLDGLKLRWLERKICSISKRFKKEEERKLASAGIKRFCYREYPYEDMSMTWKVALAQIPSGERSDAEQYAKNLSREEGNSMDKVESLDKISKSGLLYVFLNLSDSRKHQRVGVKIKGNKIARRRT